MRTITPQEFKTAITNRIDARWGADVTSIAESKSFSRYGPYSHIYEKYWSRFSKKTFEQQKAYVFERMLAINQKEIDTKSALYRSFYEITDLPTEIKVDIQWKDSKMWGANPTATCTVIGNGIYQSYKSRSVSGCGFDKESEAFAEACNQSPHIRRILITAYENTDHNDYGYRTPEDGYLPALSGGVGTECYYDIFKAAGYEMKKELSTKNIDFYIIKKINK